MVAQVGRDIAHPQAAILEIDRRVPAVRGTRPLVLDRQLDIPGRGRELQQGIVGVAGHRERAEAGQDRLPVHGFRGGDHGPAAVRQAQAHVLLHGVALLRLDLDRLLQVGLGGRPLLAVEEHAGDLLVRHHLVGDRGPRHRRQPLHHLGPGLQRAGDVARALERAAEIDPRRPELRVQLGGGAQRLHGARLGHGQGREVVVGGEQLRAVRVEPDPHPVELFGADGVPRRGQLARGPDQFDERHGARGDLLHGGEEDGVRHGRSRVDGCDGAQGLTRRWRWAGSACHDSPDRQTTPRCGRRAALSPRIGIRTSAAPLRPPGPVSCWSRRSRPRCRSGRGPGPASARRAGSRSARRRWCRSFPATGWWSGR